MGKKAKRLKNKFVSDIERLSEQNRQRANANDKPSIEEKPKNSYHGYSIHYKANTANSWHYDYGSSYTSNKVTPLSVNYYDNKHFWEYEWKNWVQEHEPNYITPNMRVSYPNPEPEEDLPAAWAKNV